MKKILSLLLMCVLMVSGLAVYAEEREVVEAYRGELSLSIGGKVVEFNVLDDKDIIYVDLETIVNALGKEFYFDEENEIIHIVNPGANQEQTGEWSESIVFDELEISLGYDIGFVEFSNQFSDKNGATVIKVPIRVKNLKSETHGLNMFYYDIYNPKGTEADDFNTFYNDSIDSAGKLRTNAEMETFLYIEYTGDGEYVIEFDKMFGDTDELSFTVNK